jgi:hypothetical protein
LGVLDQLIGWIEGQSKGQGFGLLLILGGALYMAFTGDFIVGLIAIGIGTYFQLKEARENGI